MPCSTDTRSSSTGRPAAGNGGGSSFPQHRGFLGGSVQRPRLVRGGENGGVPAGKRPCSERWGRAEAKPTPPSPAHKPGSGRRDSGWTGVKLFPFRRRKPGGLPLTPGRQRQHTPRSARCLPGPDRPQEASPRPAAGRQASPPPPPQRLPSPPYRPLQRRSPQPRPPPGARLTRRRGRPAPTPAPAAAAASPPPPSLRPAAGGGNGGASPPPLSPYCCCCRPALPPPPPPPFPPAAGRPRPRPRP